MGNPLIELRGIFKQYETEGAPPVPVLHGIDLSIGQGDFVCLMGQSGSGKSTLMNILGCLDAPSSGEYFFQGKSVSAMSSDELALLRNRKIGFVFQGFNLLKRMDVLDNVALPMVYGGLDREEALKRAGEKLESVGLAAFKDRLPNQLSGGQQQRVAIARALATEPKVLLLDEITSALDPVLVADVLEALRALAKGGMTMLIATHEMAFAADVADRICYLEGGRIVEQGTPEKIFGAPRDARTRAFLKRVRSVGASALR